MSDNPSQTLVVASFNDLFQADQALIGMLKLQSKQLLDLEDAVIVYKTPDNRIRVKQTVDITAERGASLGAWFGLLVGLILGGPLGGVISGALAGALVGRLADFGINNEFIKYVANELQPNTSALFILSRRLPPDQLADELKRFDAKIVRTNLVPIAEALLKKAVEGTLQVNEAGMVTETLLDPPAAPDA